MVNCGIEYFAANFVGSLPEENDINARDFVPAFDFDCGCPLYLEDTGIVRIFEDEISSR